MFINRRQTEAERDRATGGEEASGRAVRRRDAPYMTMSHDAPMPICTAPLVRSGARELAYLRLSHLVVNLKAAAVVEEGVIPGGVEVERVTEKVSGEADG